MSAIKGIIVEKSQDREDTTTRFWLRGGTYPHRELLKKWGCRWSKKDRTWYYIGESLPDAVQRLADAQATEYPSMSYNDSNSSSVYNIGEAKKPSDTDTTLTEATHQLDVTNTLQADAVQGFEGSEKDSRDVPKVRVIKPALDMPGEDKSDPILTAIRQTKVSELPVAHNSSIASTGRRTLTHIPQYPCGELTGSISGSVWCYGFALHDSVCVYVNMGGPRTAVEAIRAKMSKGDTVNCVPWDASAVELTAGEGDTGKYSDFMQNIPEAKFTSLILLHEMVTQPNYGGKSTTFILHVSDEQAMAQLRHHVTLLVNVPVFEAWTGYLWQAGQSAMLVRKTRCEGGLDVLTVDLDIDSWTRLLTGGLAEGMIALPTTA
jgi:hypothetical protein